MPRLGDRRGRTWFPHDRNFGRLGDQTWLLSGGGRWSSRAQRRESRHDILRRRRGKVVRRDELIGKPWHRFAAEDVLEEMNGDTGRLFGERVFVIAKPERRREMKADVQP